MSSRRVGWVTSDEDSNLRQYLVVGSVGEELERLDRLLANGDITKGEYESLKAELFQGVRSGNSGADSQEIAALNWALHMSKTVRSG